MLLGIFAIYLSVAVQYVSSESMTLDSRIKHCIKTDGSTTNSYEREISEEFAKLQIVTGLTRYHLTIFGNYNLTSTTNEFHADFLVCSWITFGYIKGREIIYDSIEMALREALIREVGATGPGTNLSILQAKSIMNTCKRKTGLGLTLTVINLQNCIHKEIKYLKALNS
ncbi:hypothetical protein FQR65_LT07892 [Abscondita terminalis]|nr:hypothetical protein FQR65_LT07892 [Abscondita terminalis]